MTLNESTFLLRIELLPNAKADFMIWQSQFRSQISQAKGFLSLEILSPVDSKSCAWRLNLRFSSREELKLWLNSSAYENLINDLISKNLIANPQAVSREISTQCQNGVTEVYVTVVAKEKLDKFHAWHEKIHKIESTFPGFQKIYIQAPNQEEKEGSWITLLQFDTTPHLENWLNSQERAEVLKESTDFVTSKESHRLLSSFGGLFTDRSLSQNPPRWKQTLLILAVLYPIVMLQTIYLTPHLTFIPVSLKTFMENSIGVTLMTWPLLPIAIYGLKWWLEIKDNLFKQLLGLSILILIFALEITLFWKLSND